ncbi:sigma-70 family RNA polymerase sigma factor [Nocardioides mangrovi]|uniref:Sigma-70 family RNA polymerase sigma factor n=1 Tax=Nocardioides mangrovi TaxID=2874580 RepID=A0ABS7U903_9ACTN|nr:sigma-70 family RNA polymerase sigma factor [Nocardioides mangrovi]MBZ5737355.1 sigma-70 family RNA polymerase sigma factor [Nocardioides mangrovi]
MDRRQQTSDLFARSLNADEGERHQLHDEIVRINMGVASDCAKRYRGRGIASDDLDQVAYLGLVKAVRGFDPGREVDFLVFAVPTIRGELRRHFRDLGWAVRPPRSIQELQGRILGAEGELAQQLGRSPRPSDLARHLEVDLEHVLDALGATGCFSPASLDLPSSEGDEALGDRLGSLDPAYDTAEARVTLAAVLRGLTPRERRILELRFFGGRTQAEIGADIGVTQMQVSRLLNRILGRLRSQLVANADASSGPAA